MKFARKCNNCGCGMNKGFVFDDGGEYYCSTACVYSNGYTKKDLDGYNPHRSMNPNRYQNV